MEINYFKNPMDPDKGMGNLMDQILEDRDVRKEEILDNLTDKQSAMLLKNYLQNVPEKSDNFVDDFSEWMEELPVNEIEKILCLK